MRTFLVVRYDRLGDRLPDGINLRRVATTLDADAQVHDGEALAAEQQDRLEDLVAQQLRLDQLDRAAVNLDQATALLAVRDRNSGLLATKGLDRLRGERCAEVWMGQQVQSGALRGVQAGMGPTTWAERRRTSTAVAMASVA